MEEDDIGQRNWDVIVVGGGPAGAAAAITAARHGACTLLLERGRMPRHKVCGEFLSPESLGLLQSLLGDSNVKALIHAPAIRRARLFVDGTTLETPLDPSARSISRHELDFALWQSAQAAGAECRQQVAVSQISPLGGKLGFRCTVQTLTPQGPPVATMVLGRSVIDASGRWSNLRPIPVLPLQSWVGLKAHFQSAESFDSVDLYFFSEGYCGIQPAAAGTVNACAMVRASARLGNSLERVFSCALPLWRRTRDWAAAMDVVATAPLLFRPPEPVRGSVLATGDAAAFVDPFIGDGISMALSSGALSAHCLARHGWRSEAGAREYAARYRQDFLPVLRNSARLRRVLAMPYALRRTLVRVAQSSGLAPYLLQSTRLRLL